MAKQDFPTIIAWLNSEAADDTVAPRHITLQIAGGEEDDEPMGIVAVASVGDEDYVAGAPSNNDLVMALDSLDDALASEAGRLLGGRDDEDGT